MNIVVAGAGRAATSSTWSAITLRKEKRAPVSERKVGVSKPVHLVDARVAVPARVPFGQAHVALRVQ